MLTRRAFLATGMLLLPSLTQSQPLVSLQPSDHWLNHPRWCLGWWLMAPGRFNQTQWRDLIRQRVGTFTSMGVPPSSTSGAAFTTTRPGGVGEVRLDGTLDHVLVAGLFGSLPVLSLTGWVRLTALDVDTSEAEVWGVSDNVALRLTATQIQGFYHYATNWRFFSANAVMLGAGWHHYGIVVDPGSGRQELYLDGRSLVVTTFTDALAYQGTNTFFGRHPSNNQRDFGGMQDDIRVYGRALSTMEVRVLYQDSRAGYPALLAPTPALFAQQVALRRRSIVW